MQGIIDDEEEAEEAALAAQDVEDEAASMKPSASNRMPNSDDLRKKIESAKAKGTPRKKFLR